MSKPFTIHEDDHSEKANMMRKAIELAFSEDDEVRGLPVNRTTDKPRTPEDEELFKSIIKTMIEEGRRVKNEQQEKLKEEE